MPKLSKARVKHRMAVRNITETKKLALETEIPWGSLRNALAGRDEITLARVYALSRALASDGEDFRKVAAEIVADPDLAAEILANFTGSVAA